MTAIRLFKLDIDLEEIAPRVVPPPHAAFKGEVSRVILDTLRKTTRPLSTRDVTYALMRGTVACAPTTQSLSG